MNLPQCEINFVGENFAEEILIVSGGRKPEAIFFSEVAKERKILAVDRGIELCHVAKIFPEVLIGDFDSAEKFSVDWAIKNKIPVERHPVDKDFTDLQLALNFAEKNYKKNSAVVTGTFGGRFDHLFSTIFSCANSNLKICLADEREIIFFLKSNEVAEVKFFQKPVAISLLPISETCDGVTIDNVHWQLSGAKLFQKIPNAISNRLEGEKITVKLHSGILAVYFAFTNCNNRQQEVQEFQLSE